MNVTTNLVMEKMNITTNLVMGSKIPFGSSTGLPSLSDIFNFI
jgi:hypothetical protein